MNHFKPSVFDGNLPKWLFYAEQLNLSKYHFKLDIYVRIDSEEACFVKLALKVCEYSDGKSMWTWRCFSLIFADATPGEKK